MQDHLYYKKHKGTWDIIGFALDHHWILTGCAPALHGLVEGCEGALPPSRTGGGFMAVLRRFKGGLKAGEVR